MPQPRRSQPQPQPQSRPSSSSRPSPSPSPEPGFSPVSFHHNGEFLSDPGPAFDPKNAPESPALEPEPALAAELEGWQESTIRSLLKTQGNVTHHFLKVGDDDTESWKQTEDDLAAMAPPLTRILNRYDATRAAAAAGDEIALAAALTAYGARNYTRRRRLLMALQDAGPVPITGVPADPGVGPDFDAEYQRTREPPPALRPKGVR